MEKVLLTDICRPKQWKTISTSQLSEEGYPVFGANGIIGFYNEYTHEEPTLLITCRGATCGTLNISLPKSYVNGNAMALDNLSKDCDLKYLYYYLSQRGFNDVISGSAQPQITRENLSKVKVVKPSLAEQKAIAAKLDKAQEIIRYNEEIITKYDALTQSLFIDMFGDPVKNEKGWEIKTIEGLVSKKKNSLKRGPFGGALKKEIFVEKGYLVYEQFHALNNDFTMERYFIDEAKFKELEGFSVKPKDIIISCSGVYLGKLAIIPDNAKEGIINQALLKLTLNESIMRNDFFVFHFTQNNFKNKYFDSNRGAGIPNFPPMSDFKKFPFISPPITLQNQFAERVAVIEAQKLLAQESLVKSQELFSSLLQESFEN